MHFTTLLPPAAAHAGTRRSHLLIDADHPAQAWWQVSGATYDAGPDDEPILQLQVRAGKRWGLFGFDSGAVLRATAIGWQFTETHDRWTQLMTSLGLTPLAKTYDMLPPKDAHGGPRRSSLLLDDDQPDQAANQIAAKRLDVDDDQLLQLRIYSAGCWTQVVLDRLLGIAAFAAADTEKASWKAAQAALRTRGFGV